MKGCHTTPNHTYIHTYTDIHTNYTFMCFCTPIEIRQNEAKYVLKCCLLQLLHRCLHFSKHWSVCIAHVKVIVHGNAAAGAHKNSGSQRRYKRELILLSQRLRFNSHNISDSGANIRRRLQMKQAAKINRDKR